MAGAIQGQGASGTGRGGSGAGGGRAARIFDIFKFGGAPDNALRGSYAAADASWKVRGLQSTVGTQASVIVPISGATDDGWLVTFKKGRAPDRDGAAGNAWSLVRTARTVHVSEGRSSALVWGIRFTSARSGAADNGWTFRVNTQHPSSTFVITPSNKTVRAGISSGPNRNEVITQINQGLVSHGSHFRATLEQPGTGSTLFPLGFAATSPLSSGGQDGVAGEPISLTFEPAPLRQVIFKIAATDTLADIHNSNSLTAFLSEVDIVQTGTVDESSDTFDVPANDPGIAFSGGVDAEAGVVVDETAKLIDVYYDAAADTLDDIFLSLETARMSPAYRGSAVSTDSPEAVGWTRSIGPITVSLPSTARLTAAEVKSRYESNPNTNPFTNTAANKLGGIEAGAQVNPTRPTFKSLTDTPAAIEPGGYPVGNAAGDAIEFIQHSAAPPGILRVSTIPAAESASLIYLDHDEYSQAGNREDRSLTPGIDSRRQFFGYSDGLAFPVAGLLSGVTSPLSRLGSGFGTTQTGASGSIELTSWQAYRIESQEHDWLAGLAKVSLKGVDYDLGGLVHQGGVWSVLISSPPTYPDGFSVDLNFKRADGSLFWLSISAVINVAGLYWWNGSSYELLETGVIVRGLHETTRAYVVGDVVTHSSAVYMALAAVAAGTALSDRTKWAILYDPTPAVAGPALLHPLIISPALPAASAIPRTQLAATGAAGATALTGTPYYRRAILSSISSFRTDYLGAGRIGYCTSNLGDTIDGPALSSGGSVTPSMDGLLTLVQETLPLGKVRIVVEATAASILGQNRTLGNLTLIQVATDVMPQTLVNTLLTVISGQPAGRRRWEAVLDDPLLKVNKLHTLAFNGASGGLIFHAGDYLTPLADRNILDREAIDHAERALIAARQRGRVRSIAGSPNLHEDNYRDIQLDHANARAYIGERRPIGSTPASASSTAWSPPAPHGDNFRGARASQPSTAGTDRYDIYYDVGRDQWRTRTDSFGNVVFWEARGFVYAINASKIPGTFHWLGARADANEAAHHVGSAIVLADIYVFYSKADRRVDVITNSTWRKGGTRIFQYEPHYLITQPDLVAALARVNEPEVLSTMPAAGFLTADSASQKLWPTAQRQAFDNRILVAADDDRLMSMEIRWREQNVSNTLQFIDRAVSITIQAGMFRHFKDRAIFVYTGTEAEATAAGKLYFPNSASNSADIFVRRPHWEIHNTDTFAEMKISYTRYRVAASGADPATDGIQFAFGRGVLTNNTAVDKVRCRILLHV